MALNKKNDTKRLAIRKTKHYGLWKQLNHFLFKETDQNHYATAFYTNHNLPQLTNYLLPTPTLQKTQHLSIRTKSNVNQPTMHCPGNTKQTQAHLTLTRPFPQKVITQSATNLDRLALSPINQN